MYKKLQILIDKIKIKKNEKKKLSKIRISTINQIYYLCKSYDINSIYNGKEIKGMLFDNRSRFYYSKGVFGFKIVECIPKNEFSYENKNYVYFNFKSSDKCKKEYNFNIKLDKKDIKLYEHIYDLIKNNSTNYFIIAGQWKGKMDGNNFYCDLNLKRQIFVVRNKER